MAAQTPKKQETTDQNNTGTELEILVNLEKTFRKNNPATVKRNTEASMDWFRKYVGRAYNRVGTGSMFRDRGLWKSQASMGKMYFFEYDALHKDTLPVWDRYPIVIFFDAYKSKAGDQILLGLNFHYLPPALRMAAFRGLLKFRTEKRYRRNTKLDFSWQVIKVLSQSKYYKHAVHAYRVDHLKSVLVEIPSQSWEMALFIPVQRFVGDISALAIKK